MNHNDNSTAAERKEMNPDAVNNDNSGINNGLEMDSEHQDAHLDEMNEAGISNNEADLGTDLETKRLEHLQKQADENYQRFLRTQADFDNFRRRAKTEREEFAKYASTQLIEQLLPVMDNLERALAASKDNKDAESLAKGVDMTFRQMLQVLENQGLKPMNAIGQPFNPDIHQAVMQVETDQFEEGIIVEEIQKGYMLKDKVLRVAMVKVSK